MTDQKAAGEVTREHRRLALLAQGYGTRFSTIPAGSDMANWLETNVYPGHRPMGSDVIAQAIADAEARGHASACHQRDQRIAELEAEVAADLDIINSALDYDTHPSAVLALQRVQDRIEAALGLKG